MKKGILSFGAAFTAALFLFPLAHGKERFEFDPIRFVEAKRFRETEGLPPKLQIELALFCNEELEKVIREELVDEKTGKTFIAVGALASQQTVSSCAGVKKLQWVDAGTTFSGREYEVKLIQHESPEFRRKVWKR